MLVEDVESAIRHGFSCSLHEAPQSGQNIL
jgi:hypothetical protein